jgi:hypothetical protein
MRTLAICFLVVGACSTGQRAVDGGFDDRAISCDCHLEQDATETLVVPWDCYCAYRYDCARTLSDPGSEISGGTRVDYPACSLTTLTIQTPGGPWIWVFDGTGNLVGHQHTSDTAPPALTCPSDPTLASTRIRAGRFPDPTCEPAAGPQANTGG